MRRRWSKTTIRNPPPPFPMGKKGKQLAEELQAKPVQGFTVFSGDKQLLRPGQEEPQFRTLVKSIANAVDKTIWHEVWKGLVKFLERKRRKHRRGRINSWSYHAGAWSPRGGKNIVATAHSKDKNVPGIEALLAIFRESGLFDAVDVLVKNHFPQMYRDYVEVNGDPNAITRVFKVMAINIDGIASAHIDSGDYKDGYCLVIPFGDYTGGDLVFHELGCRFKLKAGDAVFFKSRQLIHGNAELIKEHRFSLTFFTKHKDFRYQDPSTVSPTKPSDPLEEASDESDSEDSTYVQPKWHR